MLTFIKRRGRLPHDAYDALEDVKHSSGNDSDNGVYEEAHPKRARFFCLRVCAPVFTLYLSKISSPLQHSFTGVKRRTRSFRRKYRPVILTACIAAAVCVTLAVFVFLLFLFTEYVVLVSALTAKVQPPSPHLSDFTLSLHLPTNFNGNAPKKENAFQSVSGHVLRALRVFFVHVMDYIGVDLVARERELFEYFINHEFEKDYVALRSSVNKEGALNYDRDACVAVQAGNTSLQALDLLASPQTPFSSPSSAATDDQSLERNTYTTVEERLRRTLKRDSTVLMLFDQLQVFADKRGYYEGVPWKETAAVADFDILTEDPDDDTVSDDIKNESVDARQTPETPFSYTRRSLERTFRQVAAVFVSDRHPIGRAASRKTSMFGHPPPYVSFFGQQRATFWEVYTESDVTTHLSLETVATSRTAATTTTLETVRDSAAKSFAGSDASACHSCSRRYARPLRIDLVITYVSPNTPSFAAAAQKTQQKHRHQPSGGENGVRGKRMRDWGELRYALRSVDRFVASSPAMQQHTLQLAKDARLLADEMGLYVKNKDLPCWIRKRARELNGSKANLPGQYTCNLEGDTVSLLGDIYLVVADVDQVPMWIRADKVRSGSTAHALHVVTHAELLHRAFKAQKLATSNSTSVLQPQQQQMCLFFANQTLGSIKGNVLPTLNSRVIESLLHHIRGLSRFYFYMNNDILFGQPVTPFDFVRPLAPARQEQRFAGYKTLSNLEMASSLNAPQDASRTFKKRLQQHPQQKRAALFFEPILQREAMENHWQPSLMDTVTAAAALTTHNATENNTTALRDTNTNTCTNISFDSSSVARRRVASVHAHMHILWRATAVAMKQCAVLKVPSSHTASLNSTYTAYGNSKHRAEVSGSRLDTFERCVVLTTNRVFGKAVANIAHSGLNSSFTPSVASPLFSGFPTRSLFRVPLWVTQSPHGKQQWAMALEHFDGLVPTLTHPHATVLLDRVVMTDLIEHTLRAETDVMRLHQIRRDEGEFIPVTAFVLGTVALRRWIDRQLWAVAVLSPSQSAGCQESASHHCPDQLSSKPGASELIRPSFACLLNSTLMEPFLSPTLRRVASLLEPFLFSLKTSGSQENETIENGLFREEGVKAHSTLRTPPSPSVATVSTNHYHIDEGMQQQQQRADSTLLQVQRRLQREEQKLSVQQRAFAAAAAAEQLELCRRRPPPFDKSPATRRINVDSTNSPIRMDHLGPLYGDLHGVHSQHPFLFDHLASWWMHDLVQWTRSSGEISTTHLARAFTESNASPLPLTNPPRLNICEANPLRVAPRVRHDLLRFPIVLRRTLPLPKLYVRRIFSRQNDANTLTKRQYELRRVGQHSRPWKTLYLDVDYHWRNGWPLGEVDDDLPWRAEEAMDYVHPLVQRQPAATDALLLVTLKSREQMKELIEKFSTDTDATARPVQCTFNDDFDLNTTVAGAAVRDTMVINAINKTLDQLFGVYTNRAPRSQWEN